MTDAAAMSRVTQVGIPAALLSDPDGFGGETVGDLKCGTLVLRNGRVARLEVAPNPGRISRIVLPGLVEAHVHLDKCHTVERCTDVGGDLAAASAAQMRDKALWTEEDLRTRAERGLAELITSGCRVVRTHLDWATGPGQPERPLAWDILGEIADAALAQGITLQRAALTSIDEMADVASAEAVARHVARSGGALGSFVLHHNNRVEGLRNLFILADRFGLALDFHVDEGLDPSLDGLELIADVAAEIGFEGPVLCGHACSLASRSLEDVARIGDKLAARGIAVAALPATNLYLQGRRPGTPDRRGLTRLHELAARGVEIVIGTDNVRDAFCPVGRHDPVHSLSLAVLVGHLDPPFGQQLSTITSNARRALGLPPLTVDGAVASDLICFEVSSLSALIADAPPPKPLSQFTGVTHAD
ncbi:MAG: amidohydrolase family protein [Pseudomonadota bacterium]